MKRFLLAAVASAVLFAGPSVAQDSKPAVLYDLEAARKLGTCPKVIFTSSM